MLGEFAPKAQRRTNQLPAVLRLGWQGMQVHIGQPTDLHMTVFMTSHPFDVRRDPFTAPNGLPAKGWNAATALLNADKERTAIQKLVLAAQPPKLQVSFSLRSSSHTKDERWAVGFIFHDEELRRPSKLASESKAYKDVDS